MSITKASSAAYRTILDSLRTVAVWLVDLATGGGTFAPLTLVGFALMFGGTATYNEAITLPWCFTYASAAERADAADATRRQRARAQALLDEETAPPPPGELRPLGGLGAPPARAGGTLLQQVAPTPSPPPPPRIDDLLTPTLSRFTMTRHS